MAFSLVVKHSFLMGKVCRKRSRRFPIGYKQEYRQIEPVLYVQNASKLIVLSVTGLETLIHSKLRNPSSLRNFRMDQSDFLAGHVQNCHTNCFLPAGVDQILDVLI